MEANSEFFDLKLDREPFLHLLNECRKAEKFTDVKLKSGDKLFPAHRVVLSLFSPVLKAMISDQWSTTKISPLSEEYVDDDIVEDLLSFLYIGSIKLTPDNVHPVCMAAHFLEISELLDGSVKYLSRLLTVENVLKLFEFSKTCEIDDLNYSCCRFVNNNHEKVFESLQILELSFKHFKDLIVGLKKFWAKELRENTFECIVRWTETNLSERLNELPVLLKNIPLEELPLKYLTKTVSNHSLVKNSISSIETVSTALANYETFFDSEYQSNLNLVVIGGYNGGYLRTMSCYDSRFNLWKELPEMHSPRSHFGVTVVNQQDIIVCGGYVDKKFRKATNSMEMFNWSKQAWIKLPKMPFACAILSIAVCNDHLYAAGGFKEETNGLSKQETVQCYSFKTKTWKQVNSMTHFLGYGKLIAFKNYLYAFGGHPYIMERYDPTSDTWTIVGNMKVAPWAVNVHQNKIYVYDQINFKSYDPETNVWSSLPLPPGNDPSIVSLNGKLLTFGGYLYRYNYEDIITDSRVRLFRSGVDRVRQNELCIGLSFHCSWSFLLRFVSPIFKMFDTCHVVSK